jgi:hypothetical protein
MFQRRMFLVAQQMPNAQLAPQFRRRNVPQSQNEEEDNDIEQQEQSQQQQHKPRPKLDVDHHLQSILRLNKTKHRKKLSLSEGAEDLQALASETTSKTYSLLYHGIYKNVLQKYRMSISFILYIGLGTLFYSLDYNNRQSVILGFYEAITIGCKYRREHFSLVVSKQLTLIAITFPFYRFCWFRTQGSIVRA